MTMSASYFDLLKYAATGIASPDMTYYDKMRASTLMGGAVQTLTGIPPLSFKSDGSPLVSWSMLGNGQQQGTPTPDNPIQPEFVGVRTANLYDNNSPDIVRCYYSSDTNTFTPNQNNAFVVVNVEAGKRYFVEGAKRYSSSIIRWCTSSSAPATGVSVVRTGTFSQSDTFVLDTNPSENYLSLFLCGDSDYNGYGTVASAVAANGETLVVDNGYKIPISCAGQTTPVYLGQTQTVRRIKKLVLDGTEEWALVGVDYIHGLYIDDAPIGNYEAQICSHYAHVNSWAELQNTNNSFGISSQKRIVIHDESIRTSANFKSFLQQQYANGTPVTIWYVLETPETAIVNEPLAKIGTYADELHSTDAAVTIPTVKGSNTLTVDTTLQPSEMSITYRG